MRRRLVIVGFAAALVCGLAGTLPAAASTPGQGPRPWDAADGGASAVEVTKTMKLTVTEIRDDHTVVLLDRDQERHFVARLGDDVQITARKRKEIDGRRDLAFDDLAVGHEVKITFATADASILRVKILGKEGRG